MEKLSGLHEAHTASGTERTSSGHGSRADDLFRLPRIRAEVDRLERITVCTRPFRAQGPRIELEQIGAKRVVHNYGHGGSGWSLSWGSAELVVPLALSGGERHVAVIGCGALGLTAAIALQRAGAEVRIYAKDLPPDVRSSWATGLWSPDARVALAGAAGAVGAVFADRWEKMARASWAEFGQFTNRQGSAITFHSRFLLSELEPGAELQRRHAEDRIGFVHLEPRLRDLYVKPQDFGPGEHPFPVAFCRRISTLRFNITEYSQQLLAQFRERGGEVRRASFRAPAEFASIVEPVIVNCTGYGARALLGDDSVMPVRGQIGWLPAQTEVQYSLQWQRLSVVPRGDGVVVQVGASSDNTGWNDANEEPNRAESEEAVRALAALQDGMASRHAT